MKAYFTLLMIVASLFITSCNKGSNGSDATLQKKVEIDFNVENGEDIGLEDMYMFVFNSADELTDYKYFDNLDNLDGLDYSDLDIGDGKHTIITVFNVGENFISDYLEHYTRSSLSGVSLLELINTINQLIESDELSDMLTGSATIEGSGINYNISIEILDQPVTIGVKLVDLLLSYPESTFIPYPDAISKSSSEQHKLRILAEVTIPNSGMAMRIGSFIGTPNNDNIYRFVVSLPTNATYQVRLWSDYTIDPNTDLYYNTSDTKSIHVASPNQYSANTPWKDAFVGYKEAFTVTDDQTPQSLAVELYRPVALYNIVATDLEEYNQTREAEGLSEAESLLVEVEYAGYFPTGYDMTLPALNDSATGYSYIGNPTYTASQDLLLGSDYVLVNGEGSSVTVNINILDVTGAIISSIEGVEINYKANHVTTISGDFLTAGVRGNGVEIDTEWKGDHYVEF